MAIRSDRFRPVPRTRRARLAGCCRGLPAGGHDNRQRARRVELLVTYGLPAAILDPVEMDAEHRPTVTAPSQTTGEGRKASNAAVGL